MSEVIGSWKIIEMSLPRMRLHLAFAQLEQVAALEADRAADDAARRIGDQAQDRERRHALAAAGFADDAERFAAAHRIGHAVDGVDDPDRVKKCVCRFSISSNAGAGTDIAISAMVSVDST